MPDKRMTDVLCVEWREIGKKKWNYTTGTRGQSRGYLNRQVSYWRQRNPQFEFRIKPYQVEEHNHAS